jgi:hypothetical protein
VRRGLSGHAPPAPRVADVLARAGWGANPARKLVANAERASLLCEAALPRYARALDPWRTLCVASTEPGAPQCRANSSVPGPAAAPVPGAYFCAVYPGQVYAVELSMGPGVAPGA